MARIALTGAAGKVGRELLGAFDDDAHELVPFTHSAHADLEAERLDVTDADDAAAKLDGVDVVIHLAGASSPAADWESVSTVNIEGTKNVLDAAVANGVDRVVFASSNHVVGRYNAADADPERMTLDPAETIPADAPPRPDSLYGASKAACEALADYYAEVRELEVVTLRIGWYMTEDDLADEVDGADPEAALFARALWLSPRDCRDVHRRAATADLPENPLTLNAVSRNADRVHAITETMRAIGYRPRDDSAEVLGGPFAEDAG